MSEAEDASGKGSNLTAVEAISARLAEVTRLAEKLDARLCEAGARTRPVPVSSSAMSSSSSLFSSSTVAPTSVATSVSGQSQQISAGTPSIGTSASPSISSSPSTVLFQPKSVPTTMTTVSTSEGTTLWSSSPGASMTSTSLVAANGAISTSHQVDRILSPVLETSRVQKGFKKDVGAEGEIREESRFDTYESDDDGRQTEEVDVADEAIERSFDDSIAEDSNMEGYVTATECSITPTARSRSESFVTSPECEDLAAPATMTSACDNTWWNIEEPKFITASATVSSSAIKEEEGTPTTFEIEKRGALDTLIPEATGERQVEKIVSMEKKVEEKSGKIVKEVTETTTLRVSHDTRLGIASYRVISNTLQNHHENVNVKEIKNLERIVSPDVHEKTNGLHVHTDSGLKSDSYTIRDELSTKTDDTEHVTKFTKMYEISQEEKPRLISKNFGKDVTLSLKEYTRQHEDSGIEMSPTKKDENLEGQDFLEKARKVSSMDAFSMNGEKKGLCCCSCNCNHEACIDRYSVQQNFIDLTSVNENRRRLPLSNTS